MSNWNKKPDDEKIYRWTEFFTSWTITSEKCTRAHVQENKSIYLSIYLTIWKPFWKRVYIYMVVNLASIRSLIKVVFVFIISIIMARHLLSPYYRYHVLFRFCCNCLLLNQSLRHHLSLPLDVTGKSVSTPAFCITSNSWHYSCPRSVYWRSIVFLLVV